MNLYSIKSIKWKLEKGTTTHYERYSFRNAVSLYYIFRYKKPDASGSPVFTPWFLSIDTNDKTYGHWKPTKSKAEYASLEEAMAIATKHHEDFVKRFLVEIKVRLE